MDVAERGVASPLRGSEEEVADELDGILRESIRLRMIADVPLGAFLSGGIDSSTIVALMQAESQRPVQTFTIGFDDKAYNEAENAKVVARHLGTDHTELHVTAEQARAVIPRLPTLYDEPFADSSQVPTFLVSQLARAHVTVALSGDGGDEIFGGYNRYYWAAAIWSKLGKVPRPGRGWLAKAMIGAGPSAWARLFDTYARWLPPILRHRNPGDKLQKIAEVIGAVDRDELYLLLASTWKNPGRVVLGAAEPRTRFEDLLASTGLENFSERMMCVDTSTCLPDDILVKVDRASMGVSLEGRMPFLDPDVAAFAWRVPLAMKIRDGQGKRILRRLLARYVPASLFERPKMGFGIPVDSWLRGPLREWADTLLDSRRLREDGYFDVQAVREKWDQHCRGERNWQHYLWAVLMFQAWEGSATKS
jgi:asparagine synthase (glutamine-hydrolysing)